MIFDNLENWNKYFKTPIFEEILSKLNTLTIDTPNGIHHESNGYYFKVMSYETKHAPTIIESHKKEVDVQILLSGSEHIKVYYQNQVESTTEYSEESDCIFYKNIDDPSLTLNLFPGKMAVFFPQDIHGCQYPVSDQTENIKKIVIKIDEKLFTY